MQELGPFLVLLALGGGALTLVGAVFVWLLDETRRVERSLAYVLGAAPQLTLTARGRGVGIGFDLAANTLAVTWDKGGWCLTYGVDELLGVELILDRQIIARVFRGETGRPADHLQDPVERVQLRFIFDDPSHPDFALDIWRPGDDGRRGRLDAQGALVEGNRWIARMDALLRRPSPFRFKPAVTPANAAGSRVVAFFGDRDDMGPDAQQAIT